MPRWGSSSAISYVGNIGCIKQLNPILRVVLNTFKSTEHRIVSLDTLHVSMCGDSKYIRATTPGVRVEQGHDHD